MKKILKSVCMIAVIALAFTSCKKNDQEQVGIRITGATEAFVDAPSEDRAYVLSTGGDTQFEKDDQIMVYNVNIEESTRTNYGIYWTKNAGHDVPWRYSSGTVVNHTNLEDLFLAFYPAEIVNNGRLWDGQNEAMFELVDHQTYRKLGGKVVAPKLTLAMAGKEDIANIVDEIYIQFRNIMGIMSINMKSASSKTVESIVYEDNMFNVTGRVHLKLHEVDPDVLLDLLNNYNPNDPTYLASLNEYIQRSGYYVDDANVAMKGKVITLDCGDGVQLNPNTAQSFIITLRPLAAFGGYKLTVNFTDGTHALIDGSAYTGLDQMIRPNTRKPVNISNIDNYLQ
jgi:hypothetical protein